MLRDCESIYSRNVHSLFWANPGKDQIQNTKVGKNGLHMVTIFLERFGVGVVNEVQARPHQVSWMRQMDGMD